MATIVPGWYIFKCDEYGKIKVERMGPFNTKKLAMQAARRFNERDKLGERGKGLVPFWGYVQQYGFRCRCCTHCRIRNRCTIYPHTNGYSHDVLCILALQCEDFQDVNRCWLEVERVYETRWDCIAKLGGAQQTNTKPNTLIRICKATLHGV